MGAFVRVSRYLQQGDPSALWHWCPACERIHPLPLDRGWTFDGNLEKPTFTPSFKHEINFGDKKTVCHYTLTAGVLTFYPDCTHALRGAVPLPELPPEEGNDAT